MLWCCGVVCAADVIDTESSDDSSDSDDYDEHWKKVQFPHNPPIDKFDYRVLKPKQFIPDGSSPAVYFRAFFTDEILATIVHQINLYAIQNR
ncbi:unnamed protein product [Parnassius apollo]|uniref:(apollo) hypothetical protein n=1 Tax=Parnassius apollo TaxID=110799 RepID=A0A8S3W3Q7_PARAO|nr:unnamed protein product [Parnassius apollo]